MAAGLGTGLSTARAQPQPGRPLRKRRPGTGVGMPRFDAIMEEALEQFQVVGAALAVAKDGRLVVAKGYGMADVAANEPAVPGTLFCIASVTKPLTAVGVLKLVDDGKLQLDAKLVDVLADLKPLPGKRVVPRFHEITVRHVLYHAGGWTADNAATDDDTPTVQQSARDEGFKGPMPLEMLYRIALSEQLGYEPGTESKYSNFGYLVLRLVIERASGMPYEQYLRERILFPMGITRMRLEMKAPDYAPEESRRYAKGGQQVFPGGSSMKYGTAGNWISSAPELVRFVTAVDGTRGAPFLSARMTREMLAAPRPPYKARKNGSHFGLGWDSVEHDAQGVSFHKNGGKAGVRAWAEHMANNVDWVVLFNTNPTEPEQGPGLFAFTNRKIRETVAEIQRWPDQDLRFVK
jgi:N-acyl-D-amino-acid deacylase